MLNIFILIKNFHKQDLLTCSPNNKEEEEEKEEGGSDESFATPELVTVMWHTHYQTRSYWFLDSCKTLCHAHSLAFPYP